MRTILIIADLYHACPRIPGIAKYLARNGWRPIILTGTIGDDFGRGQVPSREFFKKNKIEVVEVDYFRPLEIFKRFSLRSKSKKKKNLSNKNINSSSTEKRTLIPTFAAVLKGKLFKLLYGILGFFFAYPDWERFWRKPAIDIASKIIKKYKINHMISSSSPATAHLIALRLKEKHDIRWVADLRDPWSNNHYYPYGIRRYLDRMLEKRTLKQADALVTVTRHWASDLKIRYSQDIHAITNGYDEEEFSRPRIKLTKDFTITYTGSIYWGRQDPSMIMEGISRCNLPIGLRLFGPFYPKIAKMGDALKINVVQYGMMPKEEVVKKQSESQMLMLMDWDDDKEKGVIPGKFFEYLASGRPIIMSGGVKDNIMHELLEYTGAGYSCNDPSTCSKILSRAYSEYKKTGNVLYNGKKSKIKEFSYDSLAKKYEQVLIKNEYR
ncbi:glycosyltransferase [Candidatus Woesearchaeota archaeon]|nr:glycosyltransferase [Candidatus Woesearchaeota archaeon]